MESSEEIDQNYKEKYKQMSAKKENYIKTLSSLEKELRKDERALQQKEKEYMRCKNQDEKKRIEFVWKTACVSFENKKKRFHRLNDKMTTLLQEMQAEELLPAEVQPHSPAEMKPAQ